MHNNICKIFLKFVHIALLTKMAARGIIKEWCYRRAASQRSVSWQPVLQNPVFMRVSGLRKALFYAGFRAPELKPLYLLGSRGVSKPAPDKGFQKPSVYAALRGALKRSTGAGFGASPLFMRVLKPASSKGLRGGRKTLFYAGFERKYHF